MKIISKFIIHVTHNLFPLNEYSEGEIKRLMTKFQEEADDLNIEITDNQLKAYIERFDALKNSPKITEKDLRKYSLTKLIKLVSASKGIDDNDEIDETPDIVYNEDGLIIYNGSKENNCLTYGSGERWCITKGSFGNYRYDDKRKNPTFYLVKDTNLPDSNPKSFFVVVVGSDNTYKVSDRTNNDVGGHGTEWDRWEDFRFVESNFPSITGLRHIFKYIPLSSKEKLGHLYKNEAMTFREWLKQPFSFKEQYLIIRKGKVFFADITNEEFIIKFIPKLPNVANILAKNNDITGTYLLLKTINSFTKQDQNSIISNIRDPLKLGYLDREILSFDVKKLLVKLNKWEIEEYQKIYLTKDDSTIVVLHLENEQLRIDLHTEDDNYNNIKINNRTIKYLLDYPKIEDLPSNILLDLTVDGLITGDKAKEIITNYKDSDDVITKKVGEDEIIFNNSTFETLKINNDKLEKISIDDIEGLIDDDDEMKNKINQNVIDLFDNSYNFFSSFPPSVNVMNLKKIINSLPYSKRNINSVQNGFIILTDDDSIFIPPSTPNNSTDMENIKYIVKPSKWDNLGKHKNNVNLNNEQLRIYYNYLNEVNKSFNDTTLLNIIKSNNYYIDNTIKKLFIKSNPPLNPNNNYIPKYDEANDLYMLINKENTSQSLQISNRSGKSIRLNLPVRKANALLGIQTQSRPQTSQTPRGGGRGRPRRGRPATNRERTPTPQPVQPTGETIDIDDLFTEQGLIRGYQTLPPGIRRSLGHGDGIIHSVNGNRGASRRQNMLGDEGAVESVVQYGRSTVYIIRLYRRGSNEVTKIASIVVQPGNRHFIVTSSNHFAIGSPSELVNMLRRVELLEVRKFILKEYIRQYPQQINEIKKLMNENKVY